MVHPVKPPSWSTQKHIMDFLLKRAFTLTSDLSENDAQQQIIKLFDSESVKYQVVNNEIRSLKTPVTLLSVDPRMYTRRNWVGINPFVFISGINVTLNGGSSKGTVIDVNINQTRGVIIYLLILLCLASIMFAIPNLLTGIAILVFGLFISYLIIFPFFIGSVLKNEIKTGIANNTS